VGASLAASLAAATLALGGPAQAAVPTLGKLAITPSTGNELTTLQAQTNAHCNAGDTGIVVYISGSGITENGMDNVLQSNTSLALVDGSDGLQFQVERIFKDIWQANAISSPSGAYTVRIACIGSDSFTETGQFSQTVNMTSNGHTNGADYSFVSQAEATTTTLNSVTPTDPVAQGTSSVLHATVSSNAGTPAGSVQFKSGSTNLGAPVTLVSGAAEYTGALPAGTNSLTANYVPSNSLLFASSSSSATSYVVAGQASITGTPKVGKSLTCSITAGATITYKWLKNGTETGVTTKDVTVPASWLNGNVTCAATVTKNANSVTQTSAAKTIALGDPLVATVKPKIKGTPMVGKLLTCQKGTWNPAAESYKYKWFRGTKAIAGATKATYKLTKADKGKKISCQVTAHKTGYADGKAKSKTVSVS